MFKLGIIEESLIGKQVLEMLKEYLVSQRIQNVPEDICPIWHVNEYHIDDDKIQDILDLLKVNIKETWYIHAFSEKVLYVVLYGKWFKLSLYRDETWEEMIDYGSSVAKVDRQYIENIPLYI